MGARRSPPPSPTLSALYVRRAWVIILFAILSAAWAWWFVHDNQRVYEQTTSFLLQPRPDLDDVQKFNAIQSAAQENAQLVRTVAGVLEGERFLRAAADQAGLAALPSTYELSASVKPGADIVDFLFLGPDPARLAEISSAFGAVASEWVSSTYGVYSFELVETQVSDGPVAPRTWQLVALAGLLGALVSIGVVFVEHRARAARSGAANPATQREPVVLLSVPDTDGRLERLETDLRSHLEPEETIERTGPRELEIVRHVTPRQPRRPA